MTTIFSIRAVPEKKTYRMGGDDFFNQLKLGVFMMLLSIRGDIPPHSDKYI